ncbi:MAG: DNA-directed RNA polymerase subunit L [Candidatus Thermoplasmatota archaeon]
MEMKILERDKNALKVSIETPDDTVVYPLISELLKDEDVAEAKYSAGHPQLDRPILFVRTKKGKPQAAIKKAAEALAGQFREARQLFEKELK